MSRDTHPCFFGGFPGLFKPKKQGKEGQGSTLVKEGVARGCCIPSSDGQNRHLPITSVQRSQSTLVIPQFHVERMFRKRPNLEEDKRATTNVQNGLVFFFSLKKALILRKSWGKHFEKVWKSVKSAKKCRNDFAL